MLKTLVEKNRSYRRFHQEATITRTTLKELVDLARLTGSAANLQPLKYLLSCDSQRNEMIFPHLAWAGYLKEWPGPSQGEQPSAYIVILGDTKISGSFGCDDGIAAQTILLGAVERRLGGCIIRNIRRESLREALKITDSLEILLVLALGKPKEIVRIEPVAPGGDIKYWRDQQGVHHVPKRGLDTIIVEF